MKRRWIAVNFSKIATTIVFLPVFSLDSISFIPDVARISNSLRRFGDIACVFSVYSAVVTNYFQSLEQSTFLSFSFSQAKKLPEDAVGDGEVESDIDEDDEEAEKLHGAGDAGKVRS